MKLILILSILISQVTYARTVTGLIHSLDEGKNGEDHLVFFESGEVGYLDPKEKRSYRDLIGIVTNRDTVRVKLGKGNRLTHYEVALPEKRPSDVLADDEDYTPSILKLNQASSVFKRMSRKYQKKSQCYNRAHIWVYDEYVRSKTRLNKVFLFFTKRYIRKYKFHWWFHVTPMAFVGGSEAKHWRMLDRRYTKGPLQSKTWTNIFIRSKKTCKVVEKFSQYFQNQSSEDCYMIKTSPFYLVPSDIDMLETQNLERTSFDPIEIEHARWEAF